MERIVNHKLKCEIFDYGDIMDAKIVDCKTRSIVLVSIKDSIITVKNGSNKNKIFDAFMQDYYLVSVDRFWMEEEEHYAYTFWVIKP